MFSGGTHQRFFFWAAAALAALAAAPPAFGAPRYTVTDLGTLSGYAATGKATTSGGRAVGWNFTSTGVEKGFLYNGTQMSVACTLRRAAGVNSSALIAGYSYVTKGKTTTKHAATCSGSTLVDLTPSGGESYAEAINDAAQVVGQYTVSNGVARAFRYQSGIMTNLGTLGGSSSVAYGINTSGKVAGESQTSGGKRHAFLWDGVFMLDLGVFSGNAGTSADQSGANDINDRNEAVGYSYGPCAAGGCSYWTHAALFGPGPPKDLGVLAGFDGSIAYGINNDSDIVGALRTVGGAGAAFLYTGDQMYNLNSLLVQAPGWFISEARDISETGEIIAAGSYSGSPARAVLLNPTWVNPLDSGVALRRPRDVPCRRGEHHHRQPHFDDAYERTQR